MLQFVITLHFLVETENRCASVFICLILFVNLLEDTAIEAVVDT